MNEWRKSSRSSTNTNCVEVAGSLDRVRDSKHPAGPVLRFGRPRLAEFLNGLRRGQFDDN